VRLKMRVIAVMIPPLFVITTEWAQPNEHHEQEEIATHADRKPDQDDAPSS